MAAYVKFESFVEAIVLEKHQLATDQLKVALMTHVNTPAVEDDVLGDLTPIAYTNLSTQDIVTISCVHTTGTLALVLTDLVLTASGAVETFRHVVIWNDDAPSDELIAWFDYGSDVTLANGETFTIDFGASLFELV